MKFSRVKIEVQRCVTNLFALPFFAHVAARGCAFE